MAVYTHTTKENCVAHTGLMKNNSHVIYCKGIADQLTVSLLVGYNWDTSASSCKVADMNKSHEQVTFAVAVVPLKPCTQTFNAGGTHCSINLTDYWLK